MSTAYKPPRVIPLKVAVIGPIGSGKTTLLRRITCNVRKKDDFTLDSKSTIGIDFVKLDVPLSQDLTVKLTLWDTAGMEEYTRVHAKCTFLNAHAVLCVFDVHDPSSYDTAIQCMNSALAIADESSEWFLVGTKQDLVKSDTRLNPKVGSHDQFKHFITSAKDNTGVKELLKEICTHCVSKIKAKIERGTEAPPEPINLTTQEEQNTKSTTSKCCT